jgi:hypothetical protein
MVLIKTADDKSKRLELPPFIQSKPKLAQTAAVPKSPAPAPVEAPVAPSIAEADAYLAKKLNCAHCREKISFPEGKFCWNNASCFGWLQFCPEYQGLFA